MASSSRINLSILSENPVEYCNCFIGNNDLTINSRLFIPVFVPSCQGTRRAHIFVNVAVFIIMRITQLRPLHGVVVKALWIV